MHLEFMVPAEAVPALIGYNGQKHKDTESRTRTRIKFIKVSDIIFAVSIIGSPDDCNLAKSLINMAIGHHLAAIKVPLKYEEDFGQIHATYDVQTFLHEVYKNKC